MKILFYGTKNYDEQFFDKLLPEFPGIEIKFIEANIHEETASLAKGYEAICAFVNADLSTKVIEELHQQGVKLILMRCAGYNNVDLKTAQKYGIKVLRVPGYSPDNKHGGPCRCASPSCVHSSPHDRYGPLPFSLVPQKVHR